jgi:hypothetical protein
MSAVADQKSTAAPTMFPAPTTAAMGNLPRGEAALFRQVVSTSLAQVTGWPREVTGLVQGYAMTTHAMVLGTVSTLHVCGPHAALNKNALAGHLLQAPRDYVDRVEGFELPEGGAYGYLYRYFLSGALNSYGPFQPSSGEFPCPSGLALLSTTEQQHQQQQQSSDRADSKADGKSVDGGGHAGGHVLFFTDQCRLYAYDLLASKPLFVPAYRPR